MQAKWLHPIGLGHPKERKHFPRIDLTPDRQRRDRQTLEVLAEEGEKVVNFRMTDLGSSQMDFPSHNAAKEKTDKMMGLMSLGRLR